MNLGLKGLNRDGRCLTWSNLRGCVLYFNW